MTYATRTSYKSPPSTRTRKMALIPRSARSHRRRLNVPEEIADLWLHRGVVAFFINPESTPNLATLLHCTQISAINFPPLCCGASLATHCPTLSSHFFPSSFSQPSFNLSILSLCPRLFSSFAFPYSSSLSASRAGGKRFQPRFPLLHRGICSLLSTAAQSALSLANKSQW